VVEALGGIPEKKRHCFLLALRGVAQALRSRGNHIVTTGIEHPAILNTCRALERDGYRITYLPVNQDGVVEIEALATVFGADTILVTVMHANNETGVVQPVEEIAVITRKRGIVFHTDAVQSACNPRIPASASG
jgi:cysteine desulfurase